MTSTPSQSGPAASTAACPASGRSSAPEIRPHRVRRPDAQRVHERVDAPRDDVAVVPARRRAVEVPLQDLVRAEDGAVLSGNVSSDRKPESETDPKICFDWRPDEPPFHDLSGQSPKLKPTLRKLKEWFCKVRIRHFLISRIQKQPSKPFSRCPIGETGNVRLGDSQV